MDYKDLRIFLAVSAAQNLARAGQELHMSASTLSRRIVRMEEEAGAQLLNRDRGPLTLTPAGELFRQHAEQTLAAWEALQSAVDTNVSDMEGSLTLYCSVTASYSFLADLLARFRERYPKVDLRLHTGDAAESIPRAESGGADVVIAARPEQLPDGLTFRTMASSPLLFIAPRALGTVPEIAQTEIDWGKVPMVLSESGLARSRVNQWFTARGVKPRIYAQVSGNEAIVSMVALGVGVGVVPELVLHNSPLASRVRVLPVRPELEPFAIGLCAQTQRMNEPLLQALWTTAVR
ncbi:MAG: HTH-type transcriptional activator IlvY [Alcanivorax sp.]|jgi:LysR family positive regulator for ilvC|nr:MAG: HTH-type transcriptional activator IlvY [Oceanobacter sp.]|tara:strand:+ start:360 stop:1235 length:876 start_codon:yes stop_codon:yes gene_type:complete